MKILWLAAAFSLAAPVSAALAADADPLAPVKAVMTIVEKNTAPVADDSNGDYVDYLSGDVLHANFSAAFIELAEKGEKRSETDEEPFIDYEPVIGGQDSCPLQDIAITNGGEKDGAVDVVAHFKAVYCFGDDMKDVVSETHFRVLTENGKPVIDDIVNIVPGEDPLSLRDVMKSYLDQ